MNYISNGSFIPCNPLKGRDAVDLYVKYFEGIRSYIQITKDI